MSLVTCTHWQTVKFTTVDNDDITICCNAHTSIFLDDGTEYCKCCYATVNRDHEDVAWTE